MIKSGIVKVQRAIDGIIFINSDFSNDEENLILKHIGIGNTIQPYIKFSDENNYSIIQALNLDYRQKGIEIAVLLVEYGTVLTLQMIVDKLRELGDYVQTKNQIPSNNFLISYLSMFEGLPSLIYNFLTKRKIVVRGKSESDIRSFILSLLQIFSVSNKKILKNISVLSISDSIKQEYDILGILEDNRDEISQEYAVVDLSKKSVYGNFDSDLSLKIANIIYQRDLVGLNQIFDKVHEYFETHQDLPKRIDIISESANISIADAELYIGINFIFGEEYGLEKII